MHMQRVQFALDTLNCRMGVTWPPMSLTVRGVGWGFVVVDPLGTMRCKIYQIPKAFFWHQCAIHGWE